MAARAPWPEASCACARPMHSELVMKMSTRMVQMAGPAAAGPSSATSSGTPMKPVFGKAATRAPNAASFRCTRRLQVTATVKNTSSSAHSSHTPNMPGCSSSSTGVFAPKRNSMQGSAKYRTKLFSPAMALSGSTFCRPAR